MKTLGNVLLIIIVAETSFGGGGRLFDTGVFSPRMLLFGLGMVYSVVDVSIEHTAVQNKLKNGICQ